MTESEKLQMVLHAVVSTDIPFEVIHDLVLKSALQGKENYPAEKRLAWYLKKYYKPCVGDYLGYKSYAEFTYVFWMYLCEVKSRSMMHLLARHPAQTGWLVTNNPNADPKLKLKVAQKALLSPLSAIDIDQIIAPLVPDIMPLDEYQAMLLKALDLKELDTNHYIQARYALNHEFRMDRYRRATVQVLWNAFSSTALLREDIWFNPLFLKTPIDILLQTSSMAPEPSVFSAYCLNFEEVNAELVRSQILRLRTVQHTSELMIDLFIQKASEKMPGLTGLKRAIDAARILA